MLVCTLSSAGHLPGGCVGDGLEGAVASLHPVGLQLRRLVLHEGGARGGRGREARGHGSRVAIAHKAGHGGRRGGVRVLVVGGWWVLGIGWAGRRVLKEGRGQRWDGGGRDRSPRWAGRWLEGRCSGGSACGAKQRGLRGRQHAGSRGDLESLGPLRPCPQSVLLWLEHASCAGLCPGCACHPPLLQVCMQTCPPQWAFPRHPSPPCTPQDHRHDWGTMLESDLE